MRRAFNFGKKRGGLWLGDGGEEKGGGEHNECGGESGSSFPSPLSLFFSASVFHSLLAPSVSLLFIYLDMYLHFLSPLPLMVSLPPSPLRIAVNCGSSGRGSSYGRVPRLRHAPAVPSCDKLSVCMWVRERARVVAISCT